MPRRFQFSLRALLVAMLVVAVFFGGIEFGTRREQQRLAFERNEVKAARDEVWRDKNAVLIAEDALKKWELDLAQERSRLTRFVNEIAEARELRRLFAERDRRPDQSSQSTQE